MNIIGSFHRRVSPPSPIDRGPFVTLLGRDGVSALAMMLILAFLLFV